MIILMRILVMTNTYTNTHEVECAHCSAAMKNGARTIVWYNMIHYDYTHHMYMYICIYIYIYIHVYTYYDYIYIFDVVYYDYHYYYYHCYHYHYYYYQLLTNVKPFLL